MLQLARSVLSPFLAAERQLHVLGLSREMRAQQYTIMNVRCECSQLVHVNRMHAANPREARASSNSEFNEIASSSQLLHTMTHGFYGRRIAP